MDLRRFCTEIGLPFGAVRIVEKMNEEISEVRYQYVRGNSGKRQKGVNMDLRRFCTEIGLPFGAVRIVEKMNEEISEVRYQYVRKLFFTEGC